TVTPVVDPVVVVVPPAFDPPGFDPPGVVPPVVVLVVGWLPQFWFWTFRLVLAAATDPLASLPVASSWWLPTSVPLGTTNDVENAPLPSTSAEPTFTGVLWSVRSIVLPGFQLAPLTPTLESHGAEFTRS